MRAQRVVITGPHAVEVQDVDLAPPGPGEMLLQAEHTLISAGTETAAIRGLTAGSREHAGRPRPIGYSFVGVVREVGPEVATWKVGQRIAGQAPHASWAVVAADRAFVRVPEDLPPEQATFVSLLAIALNGVRLAHIQIGEPVAVVGQGLVGQLAAQFARINGARPVVALDVLDSRLEIARANGATHTINVRDAGSEEELAGAVRAATGGDGPRVVVEATGVPGPVVTALKIAGHGARVVLLGSTRGLVQAWDPYTDVHKKAITIVGAHSPSSHPPVATFWNPFTVTKNMAIALDLVRDGSLHLDRLVSHRFSGDQAPEAFAHLISTPAEHLGVLLDWRRTT
ncbi:MAG: zinc-dependent alcohol dehydrogenase [Chloroflexota bacterium]